jgi:hypothetical protein
LCLQFLRAQRRLPFLVGLLQRLLYFVDAAAKGRPLLRCQLAYFARL